MVRVRVCSLWIVGRLGLGFGVRLGVYWVAFNERVARDHEEGRQRSWQCCPRYATQYGIYLDLYYFCHSLPLSFSLPYPPPKN